MAGFVDVELTRELAHASSSLSGAWDSLQEALEESDRAQAAAHVAIIGALDAMKAILDQIESVSVADVGAVR